MHAGEHLVAALVKPGGPGQVDQQVEGLAGDAVLTEVDVEVADANGQLAAAAGVVGEKLA